MKNWKVKSIHMMKYNLIVYGVKEKKCNSMEIAIFCDNNWKYEPMVKIWNKIINNWIGE